MAKIIYEHDNGHQATFDFDASSMRSMDPAIRANLLREVFKILEEEMLAEVSNATTD